MTLSHSQISPYPSNLLEGFNYLIKVFFDEKQRENFIDILGQDFIKQCEEKYNIKIDDSTYLPKGNFSTEILKVYIDRLISYSKLSLPFEKHYTFLNKLGELAISIGELETASDIYSSIIKNLNGSSEFDSLAAYASLSLGNIYARQAYFDSALSISKKCTNMFQKQNDEIGLTKTENLIGTIYAEQGRLRPAKSHFEKGLALLYNTNNSSLIAMLEVNLGIIDNMQGKSDQSLTHFQRALFKYEKMNDLRRIAEVHHNLGMLYLKKDDLILASQEFDISLELSLKHRYLPTIAISFLGKSEVNIYSNDFKLANAYLNKGMEVSYQINDKLSIADGYKLKGIILRLEKDYINSENYLFSSLRLNEQFNNKLNYSETAIELGICYFEIDRFEDALGLYQEALDYYKKIRNKSEISKIKQLISKL